MKRFTGQWLAVGLGLIGACLLAEAAEDSAPSKTLARIHWAGFGQLGDKEDGRVFRETWSLPASAQLRTETLDRLASKLAAQFEPKNNEGGNCVRLLRPLLDDLFDAEVCLEVTALSGGAVETVLAMRLDEKRTEAWRANWSDLLAGWKPRSSLRTERISMVSTNSWFALQSISGGIEAGAVEPSANSLLVRLREGARPMSAPREYWLRAEVDVASWMDQMHAREITGLPSIDLTVSGHNEYLRSQARLLFETPLDLGVEKWQIPVQTIRDPLISFTAIQGIASWLGRQSWFRELGLERVPNQLYLWELSQSAFQIQAAAPVRDATDAFERIAASTPKFNKILSEYAVGQVSRVEKGPQLVWRGLPLLVPYLGPAKDSGETFLHAGIFPVEPSPNAAPPQLFRNLTSQSNLLYYDWELTQARLTHLRPMLQVAPMFLTISPMSTNSTAAKWLDAVEPRLGNSVTEISMVSPKELSFLRTSHLGLTGLELLTMANWLETTNFPKVNLKIGFQPVVRSSRPRPAR